MEDLLVNPQPREITHLSNEPPLEFLTRHGYEVQCWTGCLTARLYQYPIEKRPAEFTKRRWAQILQEKRRESGPPAGRICLEDWMAPTSRELATSLGWYP